jgi:uncharacterized protein YecT (DUF1311 family)
MLAASPASAQMNACASAQTQSAMNICADQQYKKDDAALNQVYGKLKAKLNASDQAALQAAEKAWIAYRDAECAFETSGTAGGSIHPMVLSMCLDEKTLVHTAELNRQLNCKEGDPSCAH